MPAKRADTHDLPQVVDPISAREHPTRVRIDQRVQIDHCAILVKKCMDRLIGSGRRLPHDLADVVQRKPNAVSVRRAKRSQVGE